MDAHSTNFGPRIQTNTSRISLVDSLNLDSENRERTRLRLFQFSLRDQASNWLERLPARSITTWEDLTTRLLAQFFPPGRTAKLRNDILMFQQHHEESLSEAWTHFKELLQKVTSYGSIGSKPLTPSIRNYILGSKSPEKVLIREEAKFSVTKNVNSISLAKGEEERSDKMDETLDNTVKPTVTEIEIPVIEAERSDETKNKLIKKAEREEVKEVLSSWPVEYYLKHRINEKLIEGLVDNNRFNDSLSRARVGKVKGKTYNVLPRGPVYEAILKKKITKKEDVEGNFEIPCSIGGLKHVNALVDQGSDVNVMPYSTYMKLTDEMPAETDIRLSLASHSYIYPLGIAEDVLVEVAEHVYPVDFVILDIKENEKRPFILGTPFLTTAKAAIKFDKGTITLRSGKSKISFHRIPDSPCMTEKGVKNDIEPIAPTMTVNRLVLEWEEKIKLHLEREMEFNQWRSKNFKGKHPTLITTKGGMDDEGEVT
ncbi:zinc finger, CCHC-type containing protein [Tanacetum coccineum]